MSRAQRALAAPGTSGKKKLAQMALKPPEEKEEPSPDPEPEKKKPGRPKKVKDEE